MSFLALQLCNYLLCIHQSALYYTLLYDCFASTEHAGDATMHKRCMRMSSSIKDDVKSKFIDFLSRTVHTTCPLELATVVTL